MDYDYLTKVVQERIKLPKWKDSVLLQKCPKCGSKGVHKVEIGQFDIGEWYSLSKEIYHVQSLNVSCERCNARLGAYKPLDAMEDV